MKIASIYWRESNIPGVYELWKSYRPNKAEELLFSGTEEDCIKLLSKAVEVICETAHPK